MNRSLNSRIADQLRQMADLLAQQGANPFRVRAYRSAAGTLQNLSRPVQEILIQEGQKGLVALPHIGEGIATAISEIARSGHWAQLERLRGQLDPVKLFQEVPGIGPELARRIHDQLHIDTLEGLETAAFDGRLEKVNGIGRRRLAALRASLTSLLGRPRRQPPPETVAGPDVGLLLTVDRQYLEQAVAGELPRIAPRRFNPGNKAWLPILHMERKGWHFTALYSNSELAHRLGRTRDWVVIYFYDDHQQEGQQTVVTETHGKLKGRRVVRGRETECQAFYMSSETSS